MIYFSSDLHFNHDKDFIYTPRGFDSVKDMNEAILSNFHEIVKPNDELYLLGDIFLGDLESGLKLVHQLPGRIHLIWGNHDTSTRQQHLVKSHNVVDIIGWAGMLKYKKYHFYMSHFPTLTTNFNDFQKPLTHRILSLSGHTHSKDIFDSSDSYNVAVDAHNCYPVSLDEIIEDFNLKFHG